MVVKLNTRGRTNIRSVVSSGAAVGGVACTNVNKRMRVFAGDSRTRVTVQVGKAGGRASKRGSIGVVGSPEYIGATRDKVDNAFCDATSLRRGRDPNWNTETVDNRDIVDIHSTLLAQGELGDSDRRGPLFSKGNQRNRSDLNVW